MKSLKLPLHLGKLIQKKCHGNEDFCYDSPHNELSKTLSKVCLVYHILKHYML